MLKNTKNYTLGSIRRITFNKKGYYHHHYGKNQIRNQDNYPFSFKGKSSFQERGPYIKKVILEGPKQLGGRGSFLRRNYSFRGGGSFRGRNYSFRGGGSFRGRNYSFRGKKYFKGKSSFRGSNLFRGKYTNQNYNRGYYNFRERRGTRNFYQKKAKDENSKTFLNNKKENSELNEVDNKEMFSKLTFLNIDLPEPETIHSNLNITEEEKAKKFLFKKYNFPKKIKLKNGTENYVDFAYHKNLNLFFSAYIPNNVDTDKNNAENKIKPSLDIFSGEKFEKICSLELNGLCSCLGVLKNGNVIIVERESLEIFDLDKKKRIGFYDDFEEKTKNKKLFLLKFFELKNGKILIIQKNLKLFLFQIKSTNDGNLLLELVKTSGDLLPDHYPMPENIPELPSGEIIVPCATSILKDTIMVSLDAESLEVKKNLKIEMSHAHRIVYDEKKKLYLLAENKIYVFDIFSFQIVNQISLKLNADDIFYSPFTYNGSILVVFGDILKEILKEQINGFSEISFEPGVYEFICENYLGAIHVLDDEFYELKEVRKFAQFKPFLSLSNQTLLISFIKEDMISIYKFRDCFICKLEEDNEENRGDYENEAFQAVKSGDGEIMVIPGDFYNCFDLEELIHNSLGP